MVEVKRLTVFPSNTSGYACACQRTEWNLVAFSCRLLLLVIELNMFAGVADHENVTVTVDRHTGDALRLLFVFKCHQFDRRRTLAVPFPEPEICPLFAFMDAGDDQEALQLRIVGNVTHSLAAD